MPTIYVENKPYKVPEGKNMLEACLSLGFDIPYFCWHPALNSVGACRLCAVKLFKDTDDKKGRIVMSCMTPANEGTRISIKDPDAVKFRKSVIEWLMVNHPHDCPVCDEGGECHLQDMTLMTGHAYRRYRFTKRTHTNQDLGPFVKHEMNRCIQCYRCTRFYNDYAGGRDFGVFCWHDSVYFGRQKDGVLQSHFSGNLVEVCPTGVFTDKTLAKHYTRKWDLQMAPSICPHCGLGCNILPGERYGTLRRIYNRYNYQVNGYFICDRGRFGYEFVNSDRRIKQTICKGIPVSKADAINEISKIIKGSKKVIGIGSPRASIESNFALKSFVGADNFFTGLSKAESQTLPLILDIIKNSPVPVASLHDVGMSDAVLILGEDVGNTAPMMELALRQSVLKQPAQIAYKMGIEQWNDRPVRDTIHNQKGPLYIGSIGETVIDDIAAGTYRASPDDLARLGFAIAHEIDDQSPAVSDMSNEILDLAKRIAKDLKDAKNPLVISGTSLGNKSIIESVSNILNALNKNGYKTKYCLVTQSPNSIGLAMLGGKSLDSFENSPADTVIILENDIYRNNSEIADMLLKSAKNIIAIDLVLNNTTNKAQYVLPASAYAESTGTFINNETRAQRFFKVFNPAGDIQESWRWIKDIKNANWETIDDVIKEIAVKEPVFGKLKEAAPQSDFRINNQPIPRQPHRYSGRTAIAANTDVREHKHADDSDSPLVFSMEGYEDKPPSSEITRFWAPAWNSVQSVTKYQIEAGGPLRDGDPGIRLNEPKQNTQIEYFKNVPPAFKANPGEYLIVPAYHFFGSEELSVLSPGIAELSEKPYIIFNSHDSKNLHETIEINLSKIKYKLPVRKSNTLPAGIAVVPVGIEGLNWDGMPAKIKLK